MNFDKFWEKNFIPDEPPTPNEIQAFQRYVQSKKGWIYIMTNESYPNLVKIGMTRQENVFKREKSINSTGVISPWKIVYADQVFNTFLIEQQIHQACKDFMVKDEFFTMSLNDAQEKVEHYIGCESAALGRYWNLSLINDESFVHNGFYLDEWVDNFSF